MDKKLLRRSREVNLGERDDIERDYTAILYSKAFRRLKSKTQVFFLPDNDHISTRLDHSLYVAIISKVICRNLGLSGQLAETIAIGHDLGHSPFGHAGEKILNRLSACAGGFSHEKQSLRVVDVLEKPRDEGRRCGLNLTLAVRDGIVNHCGESFLNRLVPSDIPDNNELPGRTRVPCTSEGCVVRLVDKISYMGRDIDDAVTAGLIKYRDIPGKIREDIGDTNGQIVDFFVKDMIGSSDDGVIALSEKGSEYMNVLMKFNYERIYKHPHTELYTLHTERLLNSLFEILIEKALEIRDEIARYSDLSGRAFSFFHEFLRERKYIYFEKEKYESSSHIFYRAVTDFLASITDRLAYELMKEFIMPGRLV
ncbi:MAG: deoxyguanosinetriphosphate triphosphohydrolase family protein [Candidatus Muiribacteriaceae bacterium]